MLPGAHIYSTSHDMGTQIGQFVLFAVYYHTDGYYNHNKAKQMYEHILFDVHDDVIKPRHYPPYRPFARGIHRSRVNSPHKYQWRGALMFSLIYTRITGGVNNHEQTGDWRRHRAHYDVIVMIGVKRMNTLGQNAFRFICVNQNYISSEFPYNYMR